MHCKCFKEYQQKADKSLIDDIFSEIGLKPEERVMLVRHIKNMLVEKLESKGVYTDDLNAEIEKGINYEQKKCGPMSSSDIDKDIDALMRRLSKGHEPFITNPNGKIDEDFMQGHAGDCWLLAAIKSISNNPKGLKILNDSISVNKFGDVTVYLKGVNKTYTIYKEELEGANELANGDGDIRALEIAVNRYFKETNRDSWDPYDRYDIEGNLSDVAYDILLGTGKSIKTQTGAWGAIYDFIFRNYNNSNIIEKAKRGDAIINVAVHDRECRSAKDENNNEIPIYEDHAYSVVDADDEYIYLVNPWDSSTRIKMTHDDFKYTFNSMRTVDLA